MRARAVAVAAAAVLSLGLAACGGASAEVDERPSSPSTPNERGGADAREQVLHPGAPCAGVRTAAARCGADAGLSQPPVARRAIPGQLNEQPDGAVATP